MTGCHVPGLRFENLSVKNQVRLSRAWAALAVCGP